MPRLTIRVRDAEGQDLPGRNVEIRLATDGISVCRRVGGQITPHVVVPVKTSKQTDDDGIVQFDIEASSNFTPVTDYEVSFNVGNRNPPPKQLFKMPAEDTSLMQILRGDYDDDPEPVAQQRALPRSEFLSLEYQAVVAQGETVILGIPEDETASIDFPAGQSTPVIITAIDAAAGRFTIVEGMYLMEIVGEVNSSSALGRGLFTIKNNVGTSLDHPVDITSTTFGAWTDFSRSVPIFLRSSEVARMDFEAAVGNIQLRNLILRILRWG